MNTNYEELIRIINMIDELYDHIKNHNSNNCKKVNEYRKINLDNLTDFEKIELISEVSELDKEIEYFNDVISDIESITSNDDYFAFLLKYPEFDR